MLLPASDATSERCRSEWDGQWAIVKAQSPTAAERAARDRRLAAVEACAIDETVVRLTRAALWPDCADVIAAQPLRVSPGRTSLLEHNAEPRRALNEVALAGHALAAQLDRLELSSTAPNPPKRVDSRTARYWIERTVTPALERGVRLLKTEAAKADTLPEGTYGRAVAQLALAAAWRRLFDAPSLPGLGELDEGEREQIKLLWRSRLDVVRTHLEHARQRAAAAALIATDWPLLRRWNTGQPPGAADDVKRLLMPPVAVVEYHSSTAQLAAQLPSYVSGQLLSAHELDLETLHALLTRGFDPRLRRALDGRLANLGQPELQLLAHARLALTLHAFDPTQAQWVARALQGQGSERGRWLWALATAVAPAPAGYAAWSALGARLGPVAALDQLNRDPQLSLSTRLGTAIDAALLAPFAPDGANVHSREEHVARESLALRALAWCLPSGFLDDQACACPRFSALD